MEFNVKPQSYTNTHTLAFTSTTLESGLHSLELSSKTDFFAAANRGEFQRASFSLTLKLKGHGILHLLQLLLPLKNFPNFTPIIFPLLNPQKIFDRLEEKRFIDLLAIVHYVHPFDDTSLQELAEFLRQAFNRKLSHRLQENLTAQLDPKHIHDLLLVKPHEEKFHFYSSLVRFCSSTSLPLPQLKMLAKTMIQDIYSVDPTEKTFACLQNLLNFMQKHKRDLVYQDTLNTFVSEILAIFEPMVEKSIDYYDQALAILIDYAPQLSPETLADVSQRMAMMSKNVTNQLLQKGVWLSEEKESKLYELGGQQILFLSVLSILEGSADNFTLFQYALEPLIRAQVGLFQMSLEEIRKSFLEQALKAYDELSPIFPANLKKKIEKVVSGLKEERFLETAYNEANPFKSNLATSLPVSTPQLSV